MGRTRASELFREGRMKPRVLEGKLELAGFRIGRVTVVARAGRDARGKCLWAFTCSCGSGIVKVAQAGALHAGRHLSCGCLLRENASKLQLKAPGVSSRNRLITNYRNRAARKGWAWELTDEEFFAKVSENCYYCGSCPLSDTRTINSNGRQHGDWHFLYNGLDRVDSALGYLRSNVVTCCRTCNLAKREMPQSEFVAWLKRLLQSGGGRACRSD